MTAEALQLEENLTIISTQEENQTDAIEILVSMAKAGKIDPWNIDIVDITDKYLTNMFEMKSQNLRLTGRTFLFASILLRLKSNVLEGIDILDFEEHDAKNVEIDDDNIEDDFHNYSTNNVVSIDEVLQRRTSVRLNRNRVVTLKDLIRQLEFYEMLEKKQSLKNAHERAKRRVKSYANLSPDDIVNLAHEEFIENSVQVIQKKLEKIFNNESKVELSELVSLGINKITAYIALLFLSVEQDIELVQEEFYSDLYIVRGNGTVKV